MESVCCSITSCRTDLVLSFILSNSSMQQMPLSLRTRAPVWRTSCRVSGSFITYAVSPTALEPLPEVYWPRGTRLYTYWSSWDLLVPGSPQRRMLISARKFPLPVWVKSFLDPPKSWSRMPYKNENITSCIDVTEQIQLFNWNIWKTNTAKIDTTQCIWVSGIKDRNFVCWNLKNPFWWRVLSFPQPHPLDLMCLISVLRR